MGNTILALNIILGLLALSVGSTTEGEPLATSTSMTATSVTRKISSTFSGRSSLGHVGTSSATEETQSLLPASAMPATIGKFHKNGKKILVSNLRRGNDGVVLSNEKKQGEQEGLMKGSEGQASEDNRPIATTSGDVNSAVKGPPKREKTPTEVFPVGQNESLGDEDSKHRKDGRVEGRSLEKGSAQENASMNLRKKTRILPGSTEAYVSSVAEPEKRQLNRNSFSPKEEYDGRMVWTSPSVTLGTSEKLTPITTDNSYKNLIRFQSGGQTDWMPIVPTRRMPSNSQQLRPIGTDRMNKTFDRQSIVFPSDSRLQKESNVIPVRNVDLPRTTERQRNPVDKSASDSDRISTWSQMDTSRLPVKFRGAVKYKTNPLNDTLSEGEKKVEEEKKHQNETNFKQNIGVGQGEVKSPATVTTWLPTSSRVSSSGTVQMTMKPSFLFTLSNSTNQSKKPQSAMESSVIVPPESAKIENITKEAKSATENTTPDLRYEGSTRPFMTTQEKAMSFPKMVDAWTSMKSIKYEEAVNDTDVAVPGSVDMSESNSDSTSLLEVLRMSTPLTLETTAADVATELTVTTEAPPEPATLPQVLRVTTESSTLSSVTSQGSIAEKPEDDSVGLPVTLGQVLGSKAYPARDEDATTTSATPVSDAITLPTPLKAGSFEEMEEDGETSTESTTVASRKMSVPITPTVGTTEINRPLAVDKTTTSAVYKTTKSSTGMETTTASRIMGSTWSNNTTKLPIARTTTTTTKTTVTKSTSRTIVTPNWKNNATVTPTQSRVNVPLGETTWPGPATPSSPTTTTALLTSASYTTPSSQTAMTTTEVPQQTVGTTPPPPSATTVGTPFSFAPTTEMIDFKHVAKPEATEESIYYKNYIPTTVNPRDEITEENVPAYLRLTVQAASWTELCDQKEALREAIIRMLSGHNVTSDSVHFLNLSDRNCQEKIEESQGAEQNGTIFLPVNLFLMDKYGDFDKNLSEAFLTIWGRQGLDFDLPIRKVDFVTPIVNLTELAEPPIGGSVVAAIVISCVAGICVILLGILFVIMKRRQKRFNYGQRCTPVSLDAYSLDSVSIYNSVRRKGHRASKRSYGNAAFDDPEVPSHSVNFAGLANFSSNKEQLHEEFNIIPQVYPKAEELPEGSETKNRYSNVIPLPETRVHLTVRNGNPLSDYINANYVRGNKGAEKLYIACQAPMESTIEDFWRMIWEQQCKVILMITDLQENGIEKCADYLPPNEVTDNLRLFGDYQVTLKKRDVKDKYIISNLTLKNMETNLWREVTHLWFLGWPDQGVPTEANSLIAFLIEARSQMKIQNGATSTSPAVVHCSPGTGRTGTVIACDLCIREYEQSRTVDIPKCVFNLRRDRAGAVQTKDQYAFIYQVLNVYATKLTGGGIESI